ncbi:adenine phosphoribosyltransferase [Paucimonas lemoignei]|uniref:Adenine phosphoribosyltransferase n=1 Tax=Paucimonas lemoignei TaxID=29443 RepID=A0A4R3HXU9_PAULE|nr:adenine phosphoribosyltransferase [Paucimonas lemoignei]TCS36279.1 adenine phosphoribosyltransferase [Paucimonas lemoignei]
MDLKSLIHEVQDFPLPGILFRDISPILASPTALHAALDQMVAHMDLNDIDLVAGIESRGFILGAALAARFDKGFVAVRKAGKLPPPVEAMSYDLEYGKATLEMRAGQGRILVVDDVLATGGTLAAAIELCGRAGYEVVNVSVLINLENLNAMRFRGEPIHAVLTY